MADLPAGTDKAAIMAFVGQSESVTQDTAEAWSLMLKGDISSVLVLCEHPRLEDN